jgi:O-antigen ligase
VRRPAAGEPKTASSRAVILAGGFAGLLLAAVALPASGSVLGSYYSPRLVAFYLLVLALPIVYLVTQLRRPSALSLDLLDFALLAFAAWQLLAAAMAPTALLGWFGAYNRIGGAFYWLALVVVLLAARRLLCERKALEAFVWMSCAVVVVAVTVAVLQALKITTPWPYRAIWFGRLPGTTGNPLNLAGLCLLGVWLGLLAASGALGRRTRIVAGVGVLFSVVGLLLAVSRGADVAVVLAVLVVFVTVPRTRRRRVVALVLVALVVVGGLALLYRPGHAGVGALSSRVSLSPSAQTYGLDTTGDTRGSYWTISLQAIKARPLLGYGPGGYLVAYRRFVSAATMQAQPLSDVTDPHSVPLLIADGSGLPGLALALVCLALVASLSLPRLRSELRAGRTAGGAGWREGPLAPLACLAALLCFACVSPGDPAILVPVVLMAGLAVGAPRAEGRGVVTLPAGRAAPLLWLGLAASLAALGVVAVLGVQLLRADHAAELGVVSGDGNAATRAAQIMPAVDTYNLIAWNAHLQGAIAAGDDRQVAAGGAPYLQRGLADDPSNPQLRVALVRYNLMFSRVQAAADELHTGLRYSPTNALLQGLLGYLAQALAGQPSQRALAIQLADELAALPAKGADGWYWLSVAQTVLDRPAAAAAALEQARRLAPKLTPSAYRQRILGQS